MTRKIIRDAKNHAKKVFKHDSRQADRMFKRAKKSKNVEEKRWLRNQGKLTLAMAKQMRAKILRQVEEAEEKLAKIGL
jgi:cell division septum initiation protein DivIVA